MIDMLEKMDIDVVRHDLQSLVATTSIGGCANLTHLARTAQRYVDAWASLKYWLKNEMENFEDADNQVMYDRALYALKAMQKIEDEVGL